MAILSTGGKRGDTGRICFCKSVTGGTDLINYSNQCRFHLCPPKATAPNARCKLTQGARIWDLLPPYKQTPLLKRKKKMSAIFVTLMNSLCIHSGLLCLFLFFLLCLLSTPLISFYFHRNVLLVSCVRGNASVQYTCERVLHI